MNTDITPAINLICPGAYQMVFGQFTRGVLFAFFTIITAPLILPAIILWIWSIHDARRLRDKIASTPPPLPTS